MKEIYIIDAKRTPFGKFRGFFSDQNPIDMASQLLSKMLSKNWASKIWGYGRVYSSSDKLGKYWWSMV